MVSVQRGDVLCELFVVSHLSGEGREICEARFASEDGSLSGGRKSSRQRAISHACSHCRPLTGLQRRVIARECGAMAFRKRNVGLSTARAIPTASAASSPSAPPSNPAISQVETPSTPSPGIRPSPLDGRPVTSTGTASLDSLLAGHSGLPLGSSLLIEETGTTDYAGTLLRYYAAQGIVQGHIVHVVGMGEHWGRDLPGCTGVYSGEGRTEVTEEKESKERMKIAWRYERLGDFGAGKSQRSIFLPAVI